MATQETILTFEAPNYGRQISDDEWEIVDPNFIRVWEAAVVQLGERKLRFQNATAKIKADWQPMLGKHKQHLATMTALKKNKYSANLESILNEFPREKAEIQLSVETSDGKVSASSVAESYIHDCFLILNICAPSCCDFLHARLSSNPVTPISLSNVHFELALLGSFQKDWPKLQTLPLVKVIEWFDAVRGGGQIPTNPMEKSLFALLHISKLDMDPMIVIWIFYAFESLLQTQPGENFSATIQRLVIFLEMNEAQSKILRKKLRGLYDIRSAIVHGGFEVSHPMNDETLDGRADENYLRMSSALEYALTVLIAAIQRTIAKGWRYPKFSVGLDGLPI